MWSQLNEKHTANSSVFDGIERIDGKSTVKIAGIGDIADLGGNYLQEIQLFSRMSGNQQN
ncbi:hypothetical protein [Paenibacillus sp. Soil750]|uniref:hypothetical protein n=1 Tax=Paenibacillus sp. Soil750 TaxID=1736398 RepID=UPI000700DA5F|nr:hypothetical protein [Paenibacillus sp. Soil750]KRE73782.1 hypothetical protein ASL11_05520 [Paenibacillus sp. Soil750]